jgi:hypothetical protein
MPHGSRSRPKRPCLFCRPFHPSLHHDTSTLQHHTPPAAMTATSISIINGTIRDDAAVAELFRRQKHFAADVTLADSVRLTGQAMFNTALFTDLPAAIQAAKPVAVILRQTIESIGALYLQSEKREAVIHVADSNGDEDEHPDLAIQDIAAKKARRTSELHLSTDESDAEEISTPERIAAAMAARQKRRLATHGAKRRMSAAAGVVKALQRTSRGRTPAFTGTNNPSLNNQMISHVRKTLVRIFQHSSGHSISLTCKNSLRANNSTRKLDQVLS